MIICKLFRSLVHLWLLLGEQQPSVRTSWIPVICTGEYMLPGKMFCLYGVQFTDIFCPVWIRGASATNTVDIIVSGTVIGCCVCAGYGVISIFCIQYGIPCILFLPVMKTTFMNMISQCTFEKNGFSIIAPWSSKIDRIRWAVL